MAWISSDIKISDAIARGLPVWEVLFENWGNTISGGTSNVVFPSVGQLSLPTVYGVSIGPRSDVDRVFVAYDRQKVVSSAYDYLRPVSVGAPLVFAQPAAPAAPVSTSGLSAPPYSASSVAVFNRLDPGSNSNSDGGFQFNTFRNSLGVVSTFGVGGIAARLVNPLLHLYFHLKPDFIPPTARAPAIYNNTQILVDAGRELFASVPVCGRKRVYATAIIAGVGTVFEVGLVQATTGYVSGTIQSAGEVIVGSVTTTVANQPVRIAINPADADFINLYSTSGGGTTLTWSVRAED